MINLSLNFQSLIEELNFKIQEAIKQKEASSYQFQIGTQIKEIPITRQKELEEAGWTSEMFKAYTNQTSYRDLQEVMYFRKIEQPIYETRYNPELTNIVESLQTQLQALISKQDLELEKEKSSNVLELSKPANLQIPNIPTSLILIGGIIGLYLISK